MIIFQILKPTNVAIKNGNNHWKDDISIQNNWHGSTRRLPVMNAQHESTVCIASAPYQ